MSPTFSALGPPAVKRGAGPGFMGLAIEKAKVRWRVGGSEHLPATQKHRSPGVEKGLTRMGVRGRGDKHCPQRPDREGPGTTGGMAPQPLF